MSRSERGFTVAELMVSTVLLLVVMTGVSKLLVENSNVARGEQMTAELQASARSSLAMIVQVLRSAGWNPTNASFSPVALDPSPTTTTNFIRVFADLNEDGDTSDANEDVTIRWANNRIEWRKTSNTSAPFVILADFISNDADGDGTPETMFVPDSVTNPTVITVRITARSPVPDPQTRQFIRYTLSTDVTLRKQI